MRSGRHAEPQVTLRRLGTRTPSRLVLDLGQARPRRPRRRPARARTLWGTLPPHCDVHWPRGMITLLALDVPVLHILELTTAGLAHSGLCGWEHARARRRTRMSPFFCCCNTPDPIKTTAHLARDSDRCVWQCARSDPRIDTRSRPSNGLRPRSAAWATAGQATRSWLARTCLHRCPGRRPAARPRWAAEGPAGHPWDEAQDSLSEDDIAPFRGDEKGCSHYELHELHVLTQDTCLFFWL